MLCPHRNVGGIMRSVLAGSGLLNGKQLLFA